MASSLGGGDQPSKTLKEGERVIAPSRRPDGTLRKAVRIRPGYTPPDEVPVYASKGALWKKEVQSLKEVPPGYDPDVEAKSKSKSAKRNERKKEKRQQAAVEGEKLEQHEEVVADSSQGSVSVESLASHMKGVAIAEVSSGVVPSSNSTECSNPSEHAQDISKKIRALKKKIRLAEAQQQQDMKQEQLEKMAKLEGWRKELKLLEDRNTEAVPL